MADYAHLAKAANERLRQFERKGIESPAYRGAQTVLHQMGIRSNTAQGRRFPEKMPKAFTEAAADKLNDFVRRFMGEGENAYKTSTQRGFKEYRNSIYNTADAKYGLSEKGISADDWLKIWEGQEEKERDRKLGSDQIVKIIKAYAAGEDENRYSWDEVSQIIKESNDVKEAYNNLGISWEDVEAADSLPWEYE